MTADELAAIRARLEALAAEWHADTDGFDVDCVDARWGCVDDLRALLAETAEPVPVEGPPKPPRSELQWSWYKDLGGTQNLGCGYVAAAAAANGEWTMWAPTGDAPRVATGTESSQEAAMAAALAAVQMSGLYGVVEIGEPWNWPHEPEPPPVTKGTAISDLLERVAALERRDRQCTCAFERVHDRLDRLEARCHGMRATPNDSAGGDAMTADELAAFLSHLDSKAERGAHAATAATAAREIRRLQAERDALRALLRAGLDTHRRTPNESVMAWHSWAVDVRRAIDDST